MTIWNNIKNIFRSIENPSIPITAENTYDFVYGNTHNNASGIHLSYDVVMGYAPIYRAVSLISGYIAKVPINIYREKSDGSRIKDKTHSAYKAINVRPHELYTPFSFRQTLVNHRLIYNNAYAYISRDGMGETQDLLLLDPASTTVDYKNGRLVYITNIEGTTYEISPADIIHSKGLGRSALVGDSLLDIAREGLGLSIGLQRFNASFIKNNASTRDYIILPESVKGEKASLFREQWAKLHSGANNAHKQAFLPSGTVIESSGFSPEQSQFIASRQHDLVMIADLLNMPASKLGANINTSYNSLEMDDLAFISETIDPILVSLEQEIETKLLTEKEKESGLVYVEADRKALVSIDADKEIELLRKQFHSNMISFEEMRAKMNMPTDMDPEQYWFIPVNLTDPTVEKPAPVIVQQAPAPVETPAESDTEAETTEDDPKDDDTETTARSIARGVVERLITRLSKGKIDWTTYERVVRDHLSAFGDRAELVYELIYRTVGDELTEVLPEQRPEVLAKLNIETLMETLWSK